MSAKSLRNQLLAAIAMVLVATIALGSSTYAWFASNSTVAANMSSITATSDAAFLEISKEKTDETVTWNNNTTVDFTSGDEAKALLPARYDSASASLFETAFALAPTAATQNDATVADILSEDLNKYVWKETVYIRAQSGTYNNLTISALGIQEVATSSGLVSAGRVLAVCGDKVQVWQSSGKVSGDEYLMTNNLTQTDYATVDLYFYYDGDDTNVYTNNLSGLTAIKSAITFTANQVAA